MHTFYLLIYNNITIIYSLGGNLLTYRPGESEYSVIAIPRTTA